MLVLWEHLRRRSSDAFDCRRALLLVLMRPVSFSIVFDVSPVVLFFRLLYPFYHGLYLFSIFLTHSDSYRSITRCLAVSTAAIGSRSASIVPRYRTGRGKERVLKNTSGQLYKWTSYEATLYQVCECASDTSIRYLWQVGGPLWLSWLHRQVTWSM